MRKYYQHKRLWGCDEELNRKLGAELRSKREMSGLSQGELADKLGISQKTVSHMENAKDNLSLTKLVRYLNALDLKIQIELSIEGSDHKYYVNLVKQVGMFGNSNNGLNIASELPYVENTGNIFLLPSFFRIPEIQPNPKNYQAIQTGTPLDKILPLREIRCIP